VKSGGIVRDALGALQKRDWERFAAVLHPDVVHRTPGVPTPVLGRAAFLHLSQDAVRRTPDIQFVLDRTIEEGDLVVVQGEWRFTGPDGPRRQPSCSVIELRDGLIYRDEEYLGLSF
jgi:ketosteroid isomerase-like protein